MPSDEVLRALPPPPFPPPIAISPPGRPPWTPTRAGPVGDRRTGQQAREERPQGLTGVNGAHQLTGAQPLPPGATAPAEDASDGLGEAANLGPRAERPEPYFQPDAIGKHLVPLRSPPTQTGSRAASQAPGSKRSKRGWATAAPGAGCKARGTPVGARAHAPVRSPPGAASSGESEASEGGEEQEETRGEDSQDAQHAGAPRREAAREERDARGETGQEEPARSARRSPSPAGSRRGQGSTGGKAAGGLAFRAHRQDHEPSPLFDAWAWEVGKECEMLAREPLSVNRPEPSLPAAQAGEPGARAPGAALAAIIAASALQHDPGRGPARSTNRHSDRPGTAGLGDLHDHDDDGSRDGVGHGCMAGTTRPA